MLTFDSHAHTYRLGRVVLPSVTQILRSSGLIDYAHVPPDVLAEAQRRGTIVHQALHAAAQRDLDLDAFARDFPAYAGYVRSGMRLLAELQCVHSTEERVASASLQCAGTVDLIATYRDVRAIFDWSTGDVDRQAKDLQTAGYAMLVEGTGPIVHHRYSITLDPAGGPPTPRRHADARDYLAFRALLEARHIVASRIGQARAFGLPDTSQACHDILS